MFWQEVIYNSSGIVRKIWNKLFCFTLFWIYMVNLCIQLWASYPSFSFLYWGISSKSLTWWLLTFICRFVGITLRKIWYFLYANIASTIMTTKSYHWEFFFYQSKATFILLNAFLWYLMKMGSNTIAMWLYWFILRQYCIARKEVAFGVDWLNLNLISATK